MAYLPGLALQEELLEQRRRGDLDVLLLLEHTPVITLGRSTRAGTLLVPEHELADKGIV